MPQEFNNIPYSYPQNRFEEKVFNARLEVEKDMAKENYRNQERLRMNEIMERKRLENAEKRKQQFDEITIGNGGELLVTTRNLSVAVTPRFVCNFTYPKIIKLRNCEDTAVYYQFSCVLPEKVVKVYLAEKKMGKATYLLRKLRAVGCEIYAPNNRMEAAYVFKIFSKLLQGCTKVIEVPSQPGWGKAQDGKLIFTIEGDLTWKNVILQAK